MISIEKDLFFTWVQRVKRFARHAGFSRYVQNTRFGITCFSEQLDRGGRYSSALSVQYGFAG
ncbi:hypothetical protein MMASJCM_2410 [Mycobacteroides abscessus subsp. massiliense CCUG 48898 = JCM 15300]|nr:hypothetical protein MMASJCM_2410 [Mycobacteroides abscessus subsp. massiliense CCUG 48898 = JCM 15300]